MNLLQQTLLERWLGDRDELCAVGDDNQAIYGFTGASPSLPARAAASASRAPPSCGSSRTTARRRRCSRSRTGSRPRSRRRALPATGPRARRAAGRRRVEVEGGLVVERIRRRPTCPLEEIAILCRTNARLADFEQALHEAGHPVPGRGVPRPRGRAVPAPRRLGRRRRTGGRAGARAGARAGLAGAAARGPRRARADPPGRPDAARPPGRLARAGDGRRLRGRARAALRRRRRRASRRPSAHLPRAPRGSSSTLVFLPRLEERELPAKQAQTDEQIAEERRLLYVGITRAKRELVVTWVKKPSRFLDELGAGPRGRRARAARRLRRAEGRGGSLRGAGRTTCPPTSSSTTRRSRRSPRAGRAASTSWPPSRASGRPSSSATARVCSRRASRGLRAAGRAGSAGSRRTRCEAAPCQSASELDRRRVGRAAAAALADQRLVDAAEPARRRSCTPGAQHDRLAVHRAAGRDDEVGARDQALRVDRVLGDDHGRQAERADRSRAARRCAAARRRARRRGRRAARASAGTAGSRGGGRARRRRRAQHDDDAARGRRRARRGTAGSGSKSAR